MKASPLSYFAEYIGAFLFIFFVFMSHGHPILIGGALAFVLYLIRDYSHAHLNPVVSLTMVLNGSMLTSSLAGYILAQLLGGISAYYVYSSLK